MPGCNRAACPKVLCSDTMALASANPPSHCASVRCRVLVVCSARDMASLNACMRHELSHDQFCHGCTRPEETGLVAGDRTIPPESHYPIVGGRLMMSLEPETFSCCTALNFSLQNTSMLKLQGSFL